MIVTCVFNNVSMFDFINQGFSLQNFNGSLGIVFGNFGGDKLVELSSLVIIQKSYDSIDVEFEIF